MTGHDQNSQNSMNEAPINKWTWFLHLDRYHWFVLFVAALGWAFDTMDQQLFALARTPAMKELLVRVEVAENGSAVSVAPKIEDVQYRAAISTSIFLVGWAVGGLIFGALGDRIGRARVMLWTILMYSTFTGLSAFSNNFWDFSFYRFITGMGVGGEFAVGVALVAEAMPQRVRTYALGLLQASSTIGNSVAAICSMTLGYFEGQGTLADWDIFGFQMSAWRLMFMVGSLPAFVAVLIRWKLNEPESWVQAKNLMRSNPDRKSLGSYRELFGDPRWRRNALVGLALGSSGIVGLWGIGFFFFDLFSVVATKHFTELGLAPGDVKSAASFWVGCSSLLMNFGGFFGMYLFSYFSNWVGRRVALAIAFVLAMVSTSFTFAYLDQLSELFWMVPIMGFCLFAPFGGYAIYFPELFPTRLRSTGTSFCYNGGRLVAAVGPLTLGLLTKFVYTKENGFEEGFRWGAVTMCAIFIVGLMVLPFAPETKDQPLPE